MVSTHERDTSFLSEHQYNILLVYERNAIEGPNFAILIRRYAANQSIDSNIAGLKTSKSRFSLPVQALSS